MSKHAFWQALIFTVVIFGIGLILGFFLEISRADTVQLDLLNSEINLLDDQLMSQIISDFEIGCEVAVESTFEFADKIYFEALQLEDFDDASKFSDHLLILHRRYDLLRTLLWSETIKLKERCIEDFHTVVYLYQYNVENIDINSRQIFYSKLLFDLKERNPDRMILIPIAANTELGSVDILVAAYNVTEFPSVIIDESIVVSGIVTLEELEGMVFQD